MGKINMTIVWRDQMSVGDAAVDNDHRYLISLINSFQTSIQTFDTPANLLVALNQLGEYAKKHFIREENLQESIGYPGVESHRGIHGQLLLQLNDLIKKVGSQDSLEKAGMTKQQFIDFLRHWLIDHVIKEDLLFKPYVLNKRS